VVDAVNDGDIKYYFNKPWDDDLLTSRVNESLEYFAMKKENVRLAKIISERNKELKQINSALTKKVREQTEKLHKQNSGLKRNFAQVIRALGALTEMRYPEIGSHSQRVAFFVQKLVEKMDLEESHRQFVLIAAYLHDIGKIVLPDSVHQAPGELSTKAFEKLRSHPILGQKCLCGVEGLQEVGLMIRHHHEHWDGTGYPDNVAELAIPLGARLIRLADAFDHDAFSRGYPDLNQLNDATANLVRKSGTLFDPDLVRKFIDADLPRQLHHGGAGDVTAVKPEDLAEGMVVLEDIFTRNGLFLLPKGARLSRGMIGRVQKIDKVDKIPKAIRVTLSDDDAKEKNEDSLGFSLDLLASGVGA